MKLVNHLCLGFKAYSLWSYFWFSALSVTQFTKARGSSGIMKPLNLVMAVMSRGRPLAAILPITQAPRRVLRNVCKKEIKKNIWKKKITEDAIQKSMPSEVFLAPALFDLFCRSTDFYSDVSSRVAEADHHHPLPFVELCILIFPAVQTFARESLLPWRETDGAQNKTHFLAEMQKVLNLIGPP